MVEYIVVIFSTFHGSAFFRVEQLGGYACIFKGRRFNVIMVKAAFHRSMHISQHIDLIARQVVRGQAVGMDGVLQICRSLHGQHLVVA